MKIDVKYVNSDDKYARLYSLSKEELIEIIKIDDEIIESK